MMTRQWFINKVGIVRYFEDGQLKGRIVEGVFKPINRNSTVFTIDYVNSSLFYEEVTKEFLLKEEVEELIR